MELNNILSDIYTSYRLQELHVSSSSPNLSSIDFHFREQIFKSFDYVTLFQCMIKSVSRRTPVHYSDEWGLNYLIYRDIGSHESDPSYVLIGPYLCDTFNDSDYFSMIEHFQLPPGYMNEIRAFFCRITVIADSVCWHTLMNRMISHYLESDIAFVHIVSDLSETSTEKDAVYSLVPKSVAAFSALEARYEIEESLIHAVQQGNTAEALHYYNLFMGFYLEPRIPDELRDAKDMLLAVNTFLRKAVQQVYVHPLYIDHLNAQLTGQIENATSILQLKNLCSAIIRKYCLLVKSYSRKQYSPLVRSVLNYVDFHYQEELTLSWFAEKYSVSKNYLSSLFHKETDLTLTDYVNSTRVRHSLLLLNTTSLSIQDIAEKCGFSDANYYTRSFKKYQGITPSKYRQSIWGEEN